MALTTIIFSLSLHVTFLLLFHSIAESQFIVKTLPGFDGDLPFKLETGYISVGENDEQQLFYYFIESERDAQKDPLLLSIAGGPGGSGFFTLAFGIDWPVGAGFSYATTPEGYYTSDAAAPRDIYAFLRKWLLNHPRFIENHLYMHGESYGGKIAPMVAWEISKANERGLSPRMSLRGYLVGSPATYVHGGFNDRVLHYHNLGLISYEYLKQAEISCNGEYVDVDIHNLECQSALQVINECLDDINEAQPLEPVCPENNLVKTDQTVSENTLINIALPSSSVKPLCRDMYYTISEDWANNPSVRNALGVREGTKEEWVKANGSVVVDHYVDSVIEYHLLLARKGYHGLVYNGDHDMVAPYFTSLKWIHSLNLTLDYNWRSWKVEGQVAGYTIRYKYNESYLTFATIKASGHTAPEYTPKECFVMTSRWLSHDPL